MGLELRTGEYGQYWGNDYNSSNALTQSQKEVNAKYILKALGNKGFSINAICGMLGNMETESSLNPGRWESDRVGGEAKAHGYGLVQWTPYTKYTNWCTSHPEQMDNNIKRIIYEIEHEVQWIKTKQYNFSFSTFAKSKETPTYLADAFLKNYERPAEPNQPQRGVQAEKWYKFLNEIEPKPIPTIRVQNTRKWFYKPKIRIILRR